MAGTLFQKDMSLTQMDQILEGMLLERDFGIRILADLPVTAEDYLLLLERLKAIKTDMGLVECYRLSMLTAWIFSLRYENVGRKDYAYIVDELAALKQYSIRHFFEICNSVFNDYDLVTYFSEIRSFKELYSMIVVHAGIPEQMGDYFCDVLEKLVRTHDIKKAMEQMTDYLDNGLERVAGFVDRAFLEKLLQTAAEIMQDCRNGEYTEEELQQKYPHTAGGVIRLCMNRNRKVQPECA